MVDRAQWRFTIGSPCMLHGLAAWFDVHFDGSDKAVTLPTGPGKPGTHWYQTKLDLTPT